jgi:uncharacterized protein
MQDQYFVTSLDALEKLYDKPKLAALAKESPDLTPEYQRWIEHSPFFAIATIGDDKVDCSPRGDECAQLLKIIDKNTLIFPDRRGNNRIEMLKNLIANPHVSLLFFVPGINETLRVRGRASISVAPDDLEIFRTGETLPVTVIKVSIERVFFQCARALIRSKLWDVDQQVDKKDMPTAGQMIKAALPEFGAEAYDSELPDRQKKTLY